MGLFVRLKTTLLMLLGIPLLLAAAPLVVLLDRSKVDWRIKILSVGSRYVMWVVGAHKAGAQFSREALTVLERPAQRPAGPGTKSTSVDVAFGNNSGQDLPVRLFAPRHVDAAQNKLPVLLYIHGGGFVIQSPMLDGYDVQCRRFAAEGYLVVSPHYRLAPEHPFPAAVQDCYSALRWIASEECAEAMRQHFGAVPDLRRVLVGGDSAGGNLSFILSVLARDGLDGDLKKSNLPFKLAGALLIYPGLFHKESRSRAALANAHILNRNIMEFFETSYLGPDPDERDLRVRPLELASFAGLPPTVVLVAELDPLHDEGVLLEEKLSAAKVPVRLLEYPNAVHGFFQFHWLQDARECPRALLAALAQLQRK
eukprot:m.177610 g.177610  ORF g.177610 m.177610 type:complete len:368 (+) comp21396_c0_seq7:42-1145(+)